MLRPYQRLSRYYNAGWGDFPTHYVKLINELLQEHRMKKAGILDLACGTGVLALELAGYGHTVHGIDISPEMIAIARANGNNSGNPTFEVGDMTELHLDRGYDVVTCTFDSINYLLRRNDVRKLLSGVASVLGPGGLFVFDSNTRHLYQSHAGDTFKREIGDEVLLEESRFDRKRNLAATIFAFSDGTSEVHRQRPYDMDELAPMLGRCGLRVVHLYSWFERIPYTANAAKVFCVAEKNRLKR